jgi:MFS transporter, DHA1 family, inner membrane transport protein
MMPARLLSRPPRGPDPHSFELSHMPKLLVLFSLINLVIGSSSFVIASILVPMAQDLRVSVPAAGQSMTTYAVGTALLAPLLLLATGKWPRKHVLLLSLGLFTLGNALSALADGLPLLLAARAVMGAGAVFVAVAAGIAVAMVEPARRGQALSLVFLGMSLSYVVGVPLGAWLGLNFGWRVPIWLACACSALALCAVAALVPRDIRAPGASFVGLSALLRRADVAAALGMTLLYFGAIFSVFSFIGAVLQALSPMSGAKMSLTLMLFGVAGVCGTLVGGWATDRFGSVRTLRFLLGQFLLTLLLVPLTQGHYLPMLAAFVAWGVAGFGMMTPQQSRLVAIDISRSPVLLSLNSSMMYFGMALGAAVGGAAVSVTGFERLAWVGAPMALAALGLLWRSTGPNATA